MNEKIDLKNCEVLELRSNDIVIYKSSANKKDISPHERAEIISRLSIIFPKNKVIILFNGDNIKIARNFKL